MFLRIYRVKVVGMTTICQPSEFTCHKVLEERRILWKQFKQLIITEN